MTIQEIKKEYQNQIDPLDLDLIIAHVLGKSREFVLTHPSSSFSHGRKKMMKGFLKRRIEHEPLAYILGHKEFMGLDFKVNSSTLIPRPETELLVEKVLEEVLTMKQFNNLTILDIGTGSGNIIITLASRILNTNFIATDISKKTLGIAKENAKKYKVNKKIKFFQGNLLEPMIENSLFTDHCSLIIVANLPYLSEEIYASTAPEVNEFEPQSALLSEKNGLAHYEKLLKQIKELKEELVIDYCYLFIEFSPEQKPLLENLIKKILPKAQKKFSKDLSGSWRIARIKL